MLKKLFGKRFNFWQRYSKGDTPWDLGITPPEIVALVELERLSPGKVLDLGCGSGTNVVYLAEHGWQATGIDFIPKAIQKAKWKAKAAGVVDRTHFVVGDITKLDKLKLDAPFDLAIDIGCGHTLIGPEKIKYAEDVANLMATGGFLMIYAACYLPGRKFGWNADDIEKIFSPYFDNVWERFSDDTVTGLPSGWYRLKKR